MSSCTYLSSVSWVSSSVSSAPSGEHRCGQNKPALLVCSKLAGQVWMFSLPQLSLLPHSSILRVSPWGVNSWCTTKMNIEHTKWQIWSTSHHSPDTLPLELNCLHNPETTQLARGPTHVLILHTKFCCFREFFFDVSTNLKRHWWVDTASGWTPKMMTLNTL